MFLFVGVESMKDEYQVQTDHIEISKKEFSLPSEFNPKTSVSTHIQVVSFHLHQTIQNLIGFFSLGSIKTNRSTPSLNKTQYLMNIES